MKVVRGLRFVIFLYTPPGEAPGSIYPMKSFPYTSQHENNDTLNLSIEKSSLLLWLSMENAKGENISFLRFVSAELAGISVDFMNCSRMQKSQIHSYSNCICNVTNLHKYNPLHMPSSDNSHYLPYIF